MQQQIAGAEDLIDANVLKIAHQFKNFTARESLCPRALEVLVYALPNRLPAPEAESQPQHDSGQRRVMVKHDARLAFRR